MEPEGSESQKLAAAGRFLDAVRLYRRQHGGSLEEAWDAVERMAPPVAPPVPALLSALPVRDPAVAAEIDALVRGGKKIQAIKRLREDTDLGLKEAKDVIDRYSGELLRRGELEVPPRAPGRPTASRTGCFIATAAYGDSSAPEVEAFRHFRDRVLRRTRPGRVIIRCYYRLSPPVAAAVARSNLARALIRSLLAPAAACCRADLRSRRHRAARSEANSHGAR